MSNTVDASNVCVQSYKCSIKKITVSTEWKAPTAEIKETVTATAFNSMGGVNGKTLYLVSSPKGKDVTINTTREAGDCIRQNHKNFHIITTDNSKKANSNKDKQSSNSTCDPNNIEGVITNTLKRKIKCYEIEGFQEPFKYFLLPVPTLKNYTTTFKYLSCIEGAIKYNIISYPDISFKIEFAIGAEAKKNFNKTSKFEAKTKNLSYADTQLKKMNTTALDAELKISPSFIASTTFNGGNGKLELTINFDKDKEIAHLIYKHNSVEHELGSQDIQNAGKTIQSFKDILTVIKRISSIDFLSELWNFDSSNLVKYNLKPYTLKLTPPNFLLCYEGKYQTSKDLTRIGKYLDFGIACKPFIKISFTVDLLYLILNLATSGTAIGFLAILRNLDKVIVKILGSNYKKEYKNAAPFSADVYFNFIVSGAINGSIHAIIDTSQKDPYTVTESISGELKVDLEAGAHVSIKAFLLVAEGEVSGSGSTGIKIVEKLERHIQKGGGGGVSFIVEGIFMGLKIKYSVKANVGLSKTYSYGGNWDGDATLLKERSLFSHRWDNFITF